MRFSNSVKTKGGLSDLSYDPNSRRLRIWLDNGVIDKVEIGSYALKSDLSDMFVTEMINIGNITIPNGGYYDCNTSLSKNGYKPYSVIGIQLSSPSSWKYGICWFNINDTNLRVILGNYDTQNITGDLSVTIIWQKV